MTWFNQLGIIEIVLIGVFILLYVLYIGKIHRIAAALQTAAWRVWVKFGLRSIYFSLLMVALLGPSFGAMTKKEVKTIGKDIYIAVDLSASMNAVDIQPSRLEKVKFELKKVVDEFSADRIGLIIFSSEAFLQCPLTYDQSALQLWIESLKTSLVPSGGTDFGPALQMALDKLKTDDGSAQNQAKLVILISDGEDFGEETRAVVNELESEKIKVFAVGVGTVEGGRIPYRERSFKRDASGREVVTVLKPDALKEIAQTTGGKYFEINQELNETSKLIRTVREVKGELRDSRQMDVTANDYFYFLFAAFWLIVLDIVLTVKTVKI